MGKPEGNNHSADPVVNGGIILNWILENWDRCMDWIDLSEDRDRWRALVNAVIKLRVPYNTGNLTSCSNVQMFKRCLTVILTVIKAPLWC
jgi:hypothetical protein